MIENYVRLNIFDVMGNAVIELVNEYQKEGTFDGMERYQ